MKKTMVSFLMFGVFSLSSFTTTKFVNHEQIAFDYFISDILKRDFTDLQAIEFKGKTEASFSRLRNFKFCLKPEEKLQSLIEDATKVGVTNSKEINYDQINNLVITDFTDRSHSAKLYIYQAVRVADNFYVFLSIQKYKEPLNNYVFELNSKGEILRSCLMK
jgi:hypothetical protein